MACQAPTILKLSSACKGEIKRISLVDKATKSRALNFANGLLTQESEVCTLHIQMLGKHDKVTCLNPFKLHGEVKGRAITGTKFVEIADKFPDLIPHDALCRNCLKRIEELPAQAGAPLENDSDPDETSEEDIDQFAADKLNILNEVRAKLKLDLVKFERRNLQGKSALIRNAALEVQKKLLSLFNLESNDNPIPISDVLENVKEKLNGTTRTEKIKVAAIFSGSLTLEQTSKTFGISIRAARIASALYKTEPVLTEPPKKRRKGISESLIDCVKSFYVSDENSYVSPNAKDVVKKKRADGTIVEDSKRYILMSITELYENFKKQYPGEDYKIGRTKFGELRPFNCFFLQDAKNEVCLCIYHENIRLLYEAIGIKNYKEYISKLVCELESKECMFRRCDKCQTPETEEKFKNDLRTYIKEKYPKYEEMDIPFRQWSSSSRELLVNSSLDLESFLTLICTKTTNKFLRHHLLAKQQARFFKEQKANVDDSTAIIQVDFAENYTAEYSMEVQKAFFVKESTTIHPFVMTIRQDGKPTTISAVVISDETHHVTNSFYAFQKTICEWLKTEFPHIKNIRYFSDGAASQYKNKKNMANLRYHFEDFGIHATWHFFASCHGKGSCDAIGGCVKCKARRASKAGAIIQSPMDFFTYVSKNMKTIRSFFVSAEQVEEIIRDSKLEERYLDSPSVDNIMQMHMIKPEPTEFSVYEMSCDEVRCAAVPYYKAVKFNGSEVEIGDWIAGIYDQRWYYGQVKQIFANSQELSVRYLRKPGDETITFSTFESRDTLVPWCQIITKVNAPEKSRNRSFKFDAATIKKVEDRLRDMC